MGSISSVVTAAVASVALLLVGGGVASGETARPALPATAGSTHFVIHYDPATATADDAAAGLADFEEAYSRLVTGGGGTPNAGLRAPVSDAPRGGDGRIDVYIAAPASNPSFAGGMAVEDGATYADPLVDSGFLYMTPGQARTAFRFRAAHELMHVIQDAYVATSSLLTESTANWAAEFALPDIEPGDSQFTVPFVPLDCSYGSWRAATACGNGYRQWLFFEMLSERYGAGIIDRLWQRLRIDWPHTGSGTFPATDRLLLQRVIADEPGDATLATQYADYAASIWDPTRWATTAVDKLHREDGPPDATDVGLRHEAPATGPRTTTVDHLATRYVRFAYGSSAAPGDQLRVSMSGGTGTAPYLLSGTGPGRERTVTPIAAVGGGAFSATVPFDGASVSDVVLVLVNDGATDDVPFSWQAELLPAGPPAGPANDHQSAPMRVQPQTTTTLDVAYSGGLGADQAKDCATTRHATRGTWYVVLVDHGTLTIDPRASDFDAATAIYDVTLPGRTILWSCSQRGAGGYVSAETFAREYLVYVGRSPTSAGTGHTLRLAVGGTPNAFGTETSDVTPPTVSALTIKPRRFRAATSGEPVSAKLTGKGAQLAFTLSETADVRFAFERATAGRKAGGKCVKPTTRNHSRKRCTRYVVAGTAMRGSVPAGAVRLRLTGRRTARKALAPGTYRLRVGGTDAAGNQGTTVTAPFAIKR